MAKWTREQWEEEGRKALFDLLTEKVAVPWAEAVARISNRGWKEFRQVQPVQLEGARDRLISERKIVKEATKHQNPVITFRLRDTGLSEDALERERGRRRALYRTFMRWTGDPAACGHHAEKIVLTSMKRAAGEGQFVVPSQRVGHVPKVGDVEISRGPLDGLALLPDLNKWDKPPVAILIEVKNVHEWIYSWDRRLWELLVKAAEVAEHQPVFPVLACPHSDITAYRMGIDIGFSRARYAIQVFTPDEKKIPAEEFNTVREEFDLTATQHEPTDPLVELVDFFETEPRQRFRTSEGEGQWYEIAARRFSQLAPVILRFDALAGDIEQPERGEVHRAFEAAARDEASWTWQGGWGHARRAGS